MKTVFLVSLLLLTASTEGNSGETCKMKSIDGGEFGICSSNEFSVALWNGDVPAVTSLLNINPNLIHSCNFSTSFVYKGGIPEILTPLTFAVCHSTYQKKKELVALLLDWGANDHINCESPNLGITAKMCVNRISDEKVRSEVETLLKANGMN